MEENFKKIIGGLDNIKLSRDEKSFMLKKIYSTPMPSPFYRTSFFAYSGASVFLAIVIFGGTLVSSQGALPGDSLYSLKVQVAEPIVGVSQISPEAKAGWEEVRAVRRIDEAVKLAEQGKLTDKKAKILEDSFKKHADLFSVARDNLATTSEGKKELSTKFKTNIKEKAKKVQERLKDSPKKEDLKRFIKRVEDDIKDR